VRRVLQVDESRATPAERLDNGVDFVPTDRRGLFRHPLPPVVNSYDIAEINLACAVKHLIYLCCDSMSFAKPIADLQPLATEMTSKSAVLATAGELPSIS